MLTTQKQIRAEFKHAWEMRCREVPAYRTDKPAQRQAFSCFVDDLARDGRISDALAQRVTLQPTRTKTVWRVMGNYGQGWEELSECDTLAVARTELAEYRVACPQGSHKLQRGRVAA